MKIILFLFILNTRTWRTGMDTVQNPTNTRNIKYIFFIVRKRDRNNIMATIIIIKNSCTDANVLDGNPSKLNFHKISRENLQSICHSDTSGRLVHRY